MTTCVLVHEFKRTACAARFAGQPLVPLASVPVGQQCCFDTETLPWFEVIAQAAGATTLRNCASGTVFNYVLDADVVIASPASPQPPLPRLP